MSDYWLPNGTFRRDEALRLVLLRERVQAMPSEVLGQWAGITYGPPESREKAALARLELAWRPVHRDTPFR